jgi:2-C-methyl-D-erythritol 4-phosphate cytidylyltransferase/2-C-methyl-D-erythritol 2,4-cyclodiphosphate synthase
VNSQHEPDFAGVVVAAGRSSRFGGALAKQFQDLAGCSVLERSVRVLADHPAVGGVVVVLPPGELNGPRPGEIGAWGGLLSVVAGGRTRARSVMRGLQATPDVPYVLVHDAARPMVDPALVEAVIDETRRSGAALPCLAVADTVKRIGDSGEVAETVDRAALRLAQTPQGARRDWLLQAIGQALESGLEVTDESAALEMAGRRVQVVAGDPGNRKITSAADLEEARRMAGAKQTALRVGTGFDVHRFQAGRKLLLGGVHFTGETGLAGHSDADVVLHAAMDALLGAAGLGDIGSLFPPDDPQWKDADSSRLAALVAERVRGQGFEIVNLDLTILAERPRIGPHADRMRGAIAACLGLDPAHIGLKATTLEGLGALGRGEGIACQAVALLGG